MLLEWAPVFVLVLARIGAMMALLPGLGEGVIPSMPRIGLALGLTVLMLPTVRPLMPPLPNAGLDLGLMVASDVATGLWFGWVARQAALALPMMAQIIAYLTGLASVLQPDPELGPQATALSKLFELVAPLLFLVTGLFQLPLLALRGLFEIVPPGHVLPSADGVQTVLAAASASLALAVQLATPFLVAGLVWQVAVGILSRLVSRMQIYFVSMPGQLLAGFAILIVAGETIVLAWCDRAETILLNLPGSR